MSHIRKFASLICPEAPFLVPVSLSPRLRPINRIYVLKSTNQYATASRAPRSSSKYLSRIKKQSSLLRKQTQSVVGHNGNFESVVLLRQLLAADDTHKVMEVFPKMTGKAFLSPLDTLELARVLQLEYRRTPDRVVLTTQLLPFAETLIHDIRTKSIPPHRTAHLRLISFFKESKQYDKGYQFWSWLVGKGTDYVDAAVYGAAIELLAYQGSSRLEELEGLYIEALRRFPGTFAEYHLSPGAIVPNRSQPILLQGLPMSLLQGITTARLLHGDWKRAYQALDTALRLLPTQVPVRMFELFMLERPISEAYTVFILACRSGVVLKPDRLTSILDRLADIQISCPLTSRFTLIDRMINAIHAFMGAGGSLSGPHLSTLIKGFSNLLPDKLPEDSNPSLATVELVPLAVQELLQGFAECGVFPGASTYGAMLGLAGKAQLREIIISVTDNISTIGVTPTPVLYRAILSASGRTEESSLVESSWKALIQAAEADGTQLDMKDWLTLARACRRANHEIYAQQQLPELSHAVTPSISSRVISELGKNEPRKPDHNDHHLHINRNFVETQLQLLLNRIRLVSELIRSNRLHDFFQVPIPTTLNPRITIGPEKIVRDVYDQLTTDINYTSESKSSGDNNNDGDDVPKAQSITGYPFDELRFENWVSINELLVQAESHELQKQEDVENAIAMGTALPKESRKDKVPAFLQAPSETEDFEDDGHFEEPPLKAEVQARLLSLRGLGSATK